VNTDSPLHLYYREGMELGRELPDSKISQCIARYRRRTIFNERITNMEEKYIYIYI
jgi:hypothetical protein